MGIAVLICLAGITAFPKPDPEPEPKPNPKDIHIHIHGLGTAGSGGIAPVADRETKRDGGNRLKPGDYRMWGKLKPGSWGRDYAIIKSPWLIGRLSVMMGI